MRAHVVLLLCLAACSSSSSTPSTTGGDGGSSGSSGSSGDTPPSSESSCKVTFGGDASTVTAKNCTPSGPFVSDSTVFEFHGDADGLDAPIYGFQVKYPNGITAKTYETKDLFYVSQNIKVTSTDKIYDVDFDSRDATKTRDGSVTTVFKDDKHGTIDVVFDSEDGAHATMHIEF